MPRLELTIVSCTGLVNGEAFGTVDPYCTVQFEGKGYSTDPCPNTTAPVWNKTFRFNISDPESSQAHICVWNQNLIKDDFLGDYWLSIGDGLVQGRPDNRRVLLTKCKGNCELSVIVTALDFGSQEGIPSLNGPAATPFNPPPRQQQQYPPPPQHQQQQQQPGVQGYPTPQHQHHHQDAVVPTGRVNIRNAAFGTVLQGNRGGRISTTASSNSSMEMWQVEALDTGNYTFCTHDGSFLRAEPNCCVNTVPHCQDWERWIIEDHPAAPGKLLIRSHHGTYLSAERGSSGVKLFTNPSDGDAWEMVTLSGPGRNLDLPAGHAFIRSHHDTHLQGHGGKISSSPNMGAWETWRIEPTGDGRYALCPHDGGYLRADSDGYVNTARSCQDWEKWSIVGHPSVQGKFVIRSHHGTFLRADPGNKKVDLASAPQEWEAWDVVVI